MKATSSSGILKTYIRMVGIYYYLGRENYKVLKFHRNNSCYCHLFMNSDNSGYIIFHINYDPPGEYQFVNHVVYVSRSYKGVVLDKWLHNKSISLLAINK